MSTPNDTVQADANSWTRSVQALVAVITGKEWSETAAETWASYAEQEQVVVTVYGPYDTGKSSLIKRLLVEEGVPVPEWLGISARRETFKTDEIVCGDLSFVDTPGIATSNQDHQDLADNALTLTDALLVVLPPQLATTDAPHITDVITGDFYGPSAAPMFAPGALIVVISQMETGKYDPDESLDAFRSLCGRKRSELLSLLQRAHGNSGDPTIQVVSGDPHGSVGAQPQPCRDDYAAGREWDGVAELRALLAQLPARRARLRADAAVRYWSRIGKCAGELAAKEHEDITAAEREERSARDHLLTAEKDLDALDDGARQDLLTDVEAELRSVVNTIQGLGIDAARAETERRLDAACTAWATKWSMEIDRLGRSVNFDLAASAARPASRTYRGLVGDLLDRHPPVTAPTRAAGQSYRDLLPGMQGHVGQVFRSAYEVRIGMSKDQARVELAHLIGLGEDDQERAKYFATGKGFGSQEQADAARTSLKHIDAIETILPSLVEIGSILSAEISGRHLEHQERKRRDELRVAIDKTSKKIVARILDGRPEQGGSGLASAVRELREQLQAIRQIRNDTLAVAEKRLDQLSTTMSDLAALLHRPPGTDNTRIGDDLSTDSQP